MTVSMTPQTILVPAVGGTNFGPPAASVEFHTETYQTAYALKLYKEDQPAMWTIQFTLEFKYLGKEYKVFWRIKEELYSDLVVSDVLSVEELMFEHFRAWCHEHIAWEHENVEQHFHQQLIDLMDMPPKTLATGGPVKAPWKPPANNVDSGISVASKKLPGVSKVVVCPDKTCTVEGGRKGTLWNTVIHLNDHHHWTREAIADWIDELHDNGEINAEFAPWGEEVDTTPVDEVQWDGPQAKSAVLDEKWKNVGYTIDSPKSSDHSPWNFDALVKAADKAEEAIKNNSVKVEKLADEIESTEKVLKKKPAWSKFTDNKFKKKDKK